jgi:hypothetical protein
MFDIFRNCIFYQAFGAHGTSRKVMGSSTERSMNFSMYIFLLPAPWPWVVLKLKLIYSLQPVGQSVLVSGSHLEPMVRFCFLSDDCGFLDVGNTVSKGWFNCFWALPEQSLLGRSPAELTTIFYCLI